MDSAITSNNSFTRSFFLIHAQIMTSMLYEGIQFDKGIRVQQYFQALPGSVFTSGQLFFHSLGATAALHLAASLFQLLLQSLPFAHLNPPDVGIIPPRHRGWIWDE